MKDRTISHRQFAAALACAGLITLAGCGGGGGDQSASKPASQPSTQVPPAQAAAATARINGRIKFDGVAPKPTKIMMDADPVCQKQHATEAYTNEYVVDANGGFANVFVYVKNYNGPKPPVPSDTAIFDQKGCEYFPHVFGLRAGQPLAILNSDPTLHNVHAVPTINSQFNLAMPKQGMRVTKVFDKPEVMVKIKCDVHSWMAAYAGVLDHPYFDVSEAGGAYEIGPLPPGTYEIEAWHEKLGTMTQTITVGDNAAATADFTFTPKAGA
ncbi:MAG TPA: carboxypeptidase regulatory-like domain-containing protein [bacterium]|nr:carboxypeptidase regulatory-like domain-containing protein [bacterium]